MAESTLAATWTTLYQKVSYLLGYGRPSAPPLVDVEQDAEVQECLDKGYRSYLYPPAVLIPGQSEPVKHSWSWLRQTASASSGSPLPDNFASIVGEVYSGNNTVSRVSYDVVQSLTATGGGSGNAQYYSLVPSNTDPPTRWTFVCYPGSSCNFTYQFIPDALSAGNPNPWGGAAFSDLLEEAVLWAVESREDDDSGSTQHRERFMELLAGLVAMDLENTRLSSVKPFPFANNSTTLELGYYDYIRDIGDYMGFGGDFNSMTQEQQGIVLGILQQGLHLFYWPNIGGVPYQWTFLAPQATLAVTAGTSLYSLPSDLQSIVGNLMWPNTSGTDREIEMISETMMRRRRQNLPESNTLPRYAALYVIAPSQPSTGTRYKLQFDNPFDNSYSLNYSYRVMPSKLTANAPLPYGGVLHGETIRLACLSAAERRKTGKMAAYAEAFQQALKASMDNDSQLRPNNYGSYRDLPHDYRGCRDHGHGIGNPTYSLDGVLVN